MTADPRGDPMLAMIGGPNQPVMSFTSWNEEDHTQHILRCHLCGTGHTTMHIYGIGMFMCSQCYDGALRLKFVGVKHTLEAKSKKGKRAKVAKKDRYRPPTVKPGKPIKPRKKK